jgi:hypothetical protein
VLRRVNSGVRPLRGKAIVNLATPEIYCDVFDRLERDRIRYVVTSGIAVVLHGHVRPIADLDVVIDPAPDEANRSLYALACRGFVPSIPLPLNMLSVLRMFDPTQREVDVFVRYSIAFNDLWAGSQLRGVGGSVARVVSLEHLLRVKQFNGRPHDFLDIAGLRGLAAGGGKGAESG